MQRTFDIVLAVILLILLMPVILAIYGLSALVHGRPVIFQQQRPGWKTKPFMLYKFRSMCDTYDLDGQPLPDNKRLTKFGQLLRKTSLDELPQLWNVLKGDLSFIGPRPLLMEYLPLYNQEQARRHEVRPGITGWAQVNGRNAISWEQKFALDVWYVDNRSLRLNLKILWLTFFKVIGASGIGHKNQPTMEKFKGSIL